MNDGRLRKKLPASEEVRSIRQCLDEGEVALWLGKEKYYDL